MHVAEFLLERGADTARHQNGMRMTAWDCLLAWSRHELEAATLAHWQETRQSADNDRHGTMTDHTPSEKSTTPASARVDQQLARAGWVNCWAERRFLDPGISAEVTELLLEEPTISYTIYFAYRMRYRRSCLPTI